MRKINVDRGDYPFPLMDGVDESNYLTWVRNHSNYMSVRGALDYVRAVGVLLRGVFINFLVILPYLLLVSLVVAASHLFLEPEGEFTLAAIAGTIFCVLLFPILTPLFKLARHKKRVDTGIESSVTLRDRYERFFGGLLLLVLAVLIFESLSYFLEHFHQMVYEGDLGGLQFASVSALAIGVFSIADKVLLKLGGAVKKMAIIVIGAIGLLLPLLVVLFVADFLVFDPPQTDWSGWIFGALIALPVVMILALIVGIATSAFSRVDFAKLTFVLVAVSIGVLALYTKGTEQAEDKIHEFQTQLHESLGRLIQNDIETPGTKQIVAASALEVSQFISDAAEVPGTELRKFTEYLQFERDQWHEYRNYLSFEKAYWDQNRSNIDGEAKTRGVKLPEVADAGYDGRILGLIDLAYALDTLPPKQREIYTSQAAQLILRAQSVPLEVFKANVNRPEALIDEVIKVSVEDIDKLIGSQEAPIATHKLDTNPELAADMKAPTVLSASSEKAKLIDVENALNFTESQLKLLGSQLLIAREELAVRANYSRRYPNIYRSEAAREVHLTGFIVKAIFLLVFTAALWLFFRLTVDVNLTSIHGLYRDRLATAFLIGVDNKGEINVEKDINLGEICCHEANSQAPYHLINVALNLQGSKDIVIRDRKSDFFIFSKKYIGSNRTHYCRTDTMELVFPQVDLATAMAISAAAASPNMGRSTSAGLVAVMTLLNIRLGFWLPNPGALENWLWNHKGAGGKKQGYTFEDVFESELLEISRRWEQFPAGKERSLKFSGEPAKSPTTDHNLVGVAFSGGGIRSATVNLGITQALHKSGVFQHIDYMSTVSGGGYLGSSISALMRSKIPTESEIGGTVDLSSTESGQQVVKVSKQQTREYQFEKYANLTVAQGSTVAAGDRLLRKSQTANEGQNSVSSVYKWRIRPEALLREVLGNLNETSKWVNVSDGGHIENLACIELLRRRCKYIIVGDGEADPQHHFNGLATLIRSARIDLGIEININLSSLRLNKQNLSKNHWTVGQIHYPGENNPGLLLYLKSSVTGDEDEVIQEYRHGDPSFPHTSTADQFFTEGQFEAYRSLGQHIAEQALTAATPASSDHQEMTFNEFENWFQDLASQNISTKRTSDVVPPNSAQSNPA